MIVRVVSIVTMIVRGVSIVTMIVRVVPNLIPAGTKDEQIPPLSQPFF